MFLLIFPLATSNSSAGSVLAITHRGTSGSNSSADEQVIVAGAFTTAGSLGCVGICSWGPEQTRWSTLGSGLRSGVVTTMQTGGQVSSHLVWKILALIWPAERGHALSRRIIYPFRRNISRRRRLLVLQLDMGGARICG